MTSDMKQLLYEVLEGLRFSLGIRGVSWLENTSFTANSYAVSYDYLLTLVKVLQHLNPKNILEFGLGQSSKVLSKYHDTHSGDYTVIENDKDWKDFFMKELCPCKDISIHIVPLIHSLDDDFGVKVRKYSNIRNIVEGKKFDLISIDGPLGSERNSRADILEYIPDCLADSWCVLLDDCGRIGEQDTIKRLKSILSRNNIKYCERVYGDSKSFYLIASVDNRFFTSLF